MSKGNKKYLANHKMRIGPCISWDRDLFSTLRQMERMQLDCAQFYFGNKQTPGKPYYTDVDATNLGNWLETNDKRVYIHATVCYNPAQNLSKGGKFPLWHQSFVTDVTLSYFLGSSTVVHCGSNRGQDKQPTGGIQQVVMNLNSLPPNILTNRFGRRTSLIENSAGEGQKIGWNWQELNYFGNNLHPQYGLCIDTQHSWGAGLASWQSPQEVDSFFTNLDVAIPSRFSLLHLNDTDVSFGSRKDSHSTIGHTIWSTEHSKAGLAQLLKRCTERNVDIILETGGTLPEFALLEILRQPEIWKALELS